MANFIPPRFQAQTFSDFRLHIDEIKLRASNWVELRGWIAGVPKGDTEIESNVSVSNFVLCERPDVCVALNLSKDVAFGFSIHLISREQLIGNSLHADLYIDAILIAKLTIDQLDGDSVLIPFASDAAIELTHQLYKNPETGLGVDFCKEIEIRPDGVIVPIRSKIGFDNNRIGNYHPEILPLLQTDNTIGLDIGCGIRDKIFDNLVTIDIYPTPTATLVTPPDSTTLPFGDGIFDLVIIDSVLEHVPKPISFLSEARRVLKVGGVIVGDVPFLQPLHLAPHHYFNFTPYGLASIAEDANLTLDYAQSELHQRPEFSIEWFLRRTYDLIPQEEAEKLFTLSVREFLQQLQMNKNLINYPKEALTELAAGFRFRMSKK